MSVPGRYRVNEPGVIHQSIDGETVIINLDSGAYYSLDAVGAVIWAEAPDLWDGAGILILVASGLYIWHREMQLGLKR